MFYTNVQAYGNDILYRCVDGIQRVQKRVGYKPTLFLPCKEESKFRTVYGEYVKPLQPGTIKECRQFLEDYKDVSNFTVYGNTQYQYAFIADEHPEEVQYDFNKLVIANIDIETASGDGYATPENPWQMIVSISVKIRDSFYVFGLQPYTPESKAIHYFQCSDEQSMLEAFLTHWERWLPDIITGWNVGGYDIPYLVNRMTNIYGEAMAKRLSPWKIFRKKSFIMMGREQESIEIVGVSTLDYLDLFKKFYEKPNQENFRLNTIAKVILGEEKINFSEHDNLHELYVKNHQKFIEYNIQDVELIDKLEKKLQLLQMAVAMAYNAKVNFADVFSQVRMWDSIIFNHFKTKRLVIPPKTNNTKNEKYPGGYVKDPPVGRHNYIVSFDLNSLYPHLIMQYNISPETLDRENRELYTVEDFLDKKAVVKLNKALAGNGNYFSRESTGFLPSILQTMYNERNEFKKKQLEAKVLLVKIQDEINRRKNA